MKDQEKIGEELMKLFEATRKLDLDDDYVAYILFCVTGIGLSKERGKEVFEEIVEEIRNKAFVN